MKANKKALIIAVILLIIGIGLMAVSILTLEGNMDGGRIDTKTFTEEISKIDISLNASDIKIVSADTDAISVTYPVGEVKQYDLNVDNGTLSIGEVSDKLTIKRWYDYINFDFLYERKSCAVTIELPSRVKYDIAINSSYGDVNMSGGEFSELVCDLDYGDIEFERISSGRVQVSNNCGDIEMDEISCENIKASCNFGDIEAERLKAENILLDNDCGDIECTIVGSEADYTVNAETSFGYSNIHNRIGGEKTLDIRTDFGDIEVMFIG